jgi:hypothetical protein
MIDDHCFTIRNIRSILFTVEGSRLLAGPQRRLAVWLENEPNVQPRRDVSGLAATAATLRMDWTGHVEVDDVQPSISGEPASGLTVTTPWDGLDDTAPEIACLLADAANGVPIYQTLGSPVSPIPTRTCR